ncbi:MAG: TolC family protein [Alphaproteobacteria bacterium]|nr:TolC family protein [Alphaproteobacteria bacterium]
MPPQDIETLQNSDTYFQNIPETIVYNIPIDLLRRRPDVRAASLRAAAASASIGIAEAEIYPSLSLFGTIGISETSRGGITDVFSIAIGPSIRWNIFDFGRIRNNIRVQDARFEQALEAYKETVLQAAKEVDDTAIAFVKTKEEIKLLEQSQSVAKRAYEIALMHFQEGFSDFQRLLDAQESLLRQQDRFIVAKGQEAIALTQIYKSLAGTWRHSKETDYLSKDTKEKMQDRTNWGNLLNFGNSNTTNIDIKKVNNHDQ